MELSCPACQTRVELDELADATEAVVCPGCHCEIRPDALLTGTFVTGVLTSRDELGETASMDFDLVEQSLAPGTRIGSFEIMSEVGRGGFGSVYAARDLKLDRIVALKVPKPGEESLLQAEVFLHEARLAAAVRDANIVAVHQIGQYQDLCYICTDFIDGVTLKEHHRQRPLDLRQACELVIQIARSLHKAHEHGVIHRDLKPANILIDQEGTPFISDFGLAKKVDPALSSKTHSLHLKREIVGTPAYMSPEQALGSRSLDRRTDIYSLGLMLYELVAGQRPFSGSLGSILDDIVQQPVPSPRQHNSAIPRPLEAIILRAMAKAPADRFPSAWEFAEDLQRFLDGEPTRTCPPTGLEWWGFQLRRHRRTVIVASLILLVGAASYAASRYFSPPREIVIEQPPAIPTARVRIDSIPQRANVAIVPIDPRLRTPRVDQVIQPDAFTPVEVDLPAGDYIIEFFLPGLGPQEVRRTITEDKVQLDEIHELAPVALVAVDLGELVHVPGGPLQVADNPAGRDPVLQEVADFYIQPHEVTCRQFQATMGRLPGSLIADPSLAQDDFPVTGFEYRDALEYAEKRGMRLPDYAEFLYAATNGQRTAAPWGEAIPEDNCWDLAAVMSEPRDQTAADFADQPIFGLYSNVAELTGSTIIPAAALIIAQQNNNVDLIRELSNTVVVTGTPGLSGDVVGPLHARYFETVSRNSIYRQPRPIGFRCVRSAGPRFIRLDAAD